MQQSGISKNVLSNLEFFKTLDFIAKYIRTSKGKELLYEIRPFENYTAARSRGDLITEAKEILILNSNLPIHHLPDLNEPIAKSNILGTALEEKEIQDILNLAVISRKVYQYLSANFLDKSLFEKFSESLFVDKVFEHSIDILFTEKGTVSDNASKKLREIRKEIREKQGSLKVVVDRILRDLSESYLVQEEFVTISDGRTVLPVKAEHKRHIKGFIHSESATGKTVYIEPEETLELNNEILSLSFAEKREVQRILRQVTQKIASVSVQLKNSLMAVSEIDLIFAAAQYSTEVIGAFPQTDENSKFQILNGRHPVLIKLLGMNKVVPLNLEFDVDRIILITGPNAGGKTVVLKTVGLLSILALCGLHIPVHPDSNIRSITNVKLDIGDKQSIEDDLSTFSSHLTNTLEIIQNIDDHTLVLLDEIGTGTDPTEGAALSTAVLDKLNAENAFVLATTHHGNLKIFANETAGIQNAAMQFDVENLQPTYNFIQGTPGSSYAFEVAQRIGFTEELIEKAKKYVDTDKYKLEDFLTKIEHKSNELQKKLNDIEIENTRLKGLTNIYKNKVSQLETQRKEILKKSRVEAEEYLRNVNKTLESAIKKIRESNADKEVVREERNKILKIKQTNREYFEEAKKGIIEVGDLEPGDYVSVRDTTTEGEITMIDTARKIAEIKSGKVKIKVKLNRLIKTKKRKTKIETSGGYSIRQVPNIRLDIRGKRSEEVDFEIVRFLDEAYSSGVESVEILHGKGTGALKQTTHEILKQHENVKNYYFAKIEMGGEGITIVELK